MFVESEPEKSNSSPFSIEKRIQRSQGKKHQGQRKLIQDVEWALSCSFGEKQKKSPSFIVKLDVGLRDPFCSQYQVQRTPWASDNVLQVISGVNLFCMRLYSSQDE